MAERTVSTTEARLHFGELLDSVAKRNDIVFVERAGVAQVVVVSVEEWRRYTAGREYGPWAEATRMLEEHWAYMRERYGSSMDEVDWAEEIRAGREEQDAQIIDAVRGR
jgi:prevent-host-death family protein